MTPIHILLRLIYLRYEFVETFLGLFVANLTELFALFFRDSDLHFCEGALLRDFAIEDLLFRIHIVVAIKVDRLGPCRCIDHLLLHSFEVELGLLLLRKLIAAL